MPSWTPDTNRYIILDGGMGTLLQQRGLGPGRPAEEMNLEHPDVVTAIHRAYIEAGADIILTNTFGAAKLEGTGIDPDEAVRAAVRCAAEARQGTKALVALDIGPIGELLEPGGTLSFEEAHSRFARMVKTGTEAGADLILIETMADLYEAKAALLAAKEHSTLPVLLSMTFEEGGRSFTGTPVEALAVALGAMGPAAIGINCSMGPEGIIPLAKRLAAVSDLPIFIKPNAGLPNPITGQHDLSPEDFVREMEAAKEAGVCMVGGCCGTTPEHIARLKAAFLGHKPVSIVRTPGSRLCSGTRLLTVDGICPIGERINPTGKKKLKAALASGDLAYIQTLAVEQERDGAAVLDVNVGAPGVDETDLLPRAVKAVQAVSGLPVQIDSSSPTAVEAALRAVNGKAIVNSTTGEAEKLAAILPLCKKYGAAVVGLTIDETGIPETAEARFAVAERICEAADRYGIAREDVYIDCLTLATSALPGSADVTLEAMRMVRDNLGCKTLLGVSNISFGLPNRPLVNRTFLTLALEAGLGLPILNPGDAGMMGTVAAFRLLKGQDPDARDFIARFGGEEPGTAPQKTGDIPLGDAILSGLAEAAAGAARRLLADMDGMAIVNSHLMPALDEVGRGFESGRVFLPQLLSSAGAAQAAFEVIRAALSRDGVPTGGPPVVLATVKGDVHDIGKNIVKVLLENYGFSVIDLGRDVPPARVVEAAQQSGAGLVGLSALMTTTLPSMADTIAALRQAGLNCKVMVGGAVLTGDYARRIGADFYGSDATRAAQYAREIHNML